MARKKEAKVEVVNEVAISKTLVLVTYSDGTSEIRFKLTSDELEKLVAAVSPTEEEEDEEEEEEDEEEDEEEEDEVSPEDLAEMDFEALEDLCDDKELETDPDEFDEEDVEKLRKAVAKELGITLPNGKGASKKDTKKKKK